jgi:hypothetical protein
VRVSRKQLLHLQQPSMVHLGQQQQVESLLLAMRTCSVQLPQQQP